MKCEGIPASGGIGIGTAVLVAEPDLGYGGGKGPADRRRGRLYP